MTSIERRTVATLAGVFSLRLFGLFLILPVFVLYAEELEGNTPFLMGVALGAYGLTQALFQIPYGLASDRFGRKPMIAMGLLIFAAGSVVAAMSDSILGVIVGRALQGAGAIAAVVIALVADLTREDQRTKAMALIGMTIGITFLASLILGPLLNGWIGVKGIFWLTAVLAVLGIVVSGYWVPTPVAGLRHRDVQPVPAQFLRVLKDAGLLRLDLGIFVLHFVLTALFVVVPLALVHEAGLATDLHWRIYLPVLLLSVVAMIPLLFLSARRHLMRWVFAIGVALLLGAQGVFYLGYQSLAGLAFALWAFFVGFNLLEALLPSLVSRMAPADSKGTAIGVYNSFEFFGVFLGGTLGGYVRGAYGLNAVFILSGVVLAVWLVVVITAPVPRLLETHLLKVGPQPPAEARALAERLAAIPGVSEAIVIAEEGVAYLKVDTGVVDTAMLDEYAVTSN